MKFDTDIPFIERHIKELITSKIGSRKPARSIYKPLNSPEGKARSMRLLEKGFSNIRSFIRVEDIFEPLTDLHRKRRVLTEQSP
jgi:hypothetical protein